jgi:hypothetical protein
MSDYLQKLEELKKLKDEGVLTPEEFEREKKKILAEGDKPAPVAAPAPQTIVVKKGGGCAKVVAIIAAVLLLLFILSGIFGGGGSNTTSVNSSTSAATSTPVPSRDEGDLLADDMRFFESFHAPNYRGNVAALLNEVRRFSQVWANMEQAKLLPEHKQTIATLKTKLVALQKSEYPKIRKEYGSIVKNLMWEHNVEVSTSGTTITFTAGMFASNAEIKGFHETVHSTLSALRFKQVRYKWFSGDDEYTYYKIDSPSDGDKIEHYEIPS